MIPLLAKYDVSLDVTGLHHPRRSRWRHSSRDSVPEAAVIAPPEANSEASTHAAKPEGGAFRSVCPNGANTHAHHNSMAPVMESFTMSEVAEVISLNTLKNKQNSGLRNMKAYTQPPNTT
jgi:hypothetical protein